MKKAIPSEERTRIDKIQVIGAREHNLKNISVDIPRNSLTVITGLSGSGKSSLAFDTIYAEGQRRYVESLSSYARQFLGLMEKPDVDEILGLSPAISIDQKGVSQNPRSTVGTVTEIYDYLRLLYARVGKPHCPQCHIPIATTSLDQIVDRVLQLEQGIPLTILAPVVQGRKGEYQGLFEEIRQQGFSKVRVNGEMHSLEESIRLPKYKKHNIDIVVDRLLLSPEERSRLSESLETALNLAKGVVKVDCNGSKKSPAPSKHRLEDTSYLFSTHFSCPQCGTSLGEIEPRLFSFNSPYGACPECKGLGARFQVDEQKVLSDLEKSIEEKGILPWSITTSNFYTQVVRAAAAAKGMDTHLPIKFLPKAQRDYLLYGSAEPELLRIHFRNRRGRPRALHLYFHGIVPLLERRYRETESEYVRSEIEKYMTQKPCSACQGTRLKKEALSILIQEKTIAEVCSLTVAEAHAFLDNVRLTEREAHIAQQILKELRARLQFLINVGLSYLTLDRTSSTLAGGEAQRIRLATQIGSGLMGVLYILDEPSIGLHPRDQRQLLDTLKGLRDLGNTVVVVEHDEETIRAADWILDLGPGAGREGGEVTASGTLPHIVSEERSLTGKYLSGERRISIPQKRRKPKQWITLRGVQKFNLKNIDVRIPLSTFVCLTGVSGSGKSTLLEEVLYKTLTGALRPGAENGIVKSVEGLEYVDKVIEIDQSPIGRTPRSNPATYTKVFDPIRTLFASTLDAKARGYKPGRFSFNVRGGRCEACKGDGQIQIAMHFLPDVYIPCEVCQGKRYNRETLQITYRGKTIHDVLSMRVDEALQFFAPIPSIHRILKTMDDVGLSYIELGQPAPTLSGGEAQRVKLASELCRKATGSTLYLLDEPTTGLHFADVERLLAVLQQLVSLGNTVVVIEHNLEVIKCADYCIDLGPEGGELGGEIVACGTPEDIAKEKRSYTGNFLKKVLRFRSRKNP